MKKYSFEILLRNEENKIKSKIKYKKYLLPNINEYFKHQKGVIN